MRIETDQHLRLIVPLAWTDLKPRVLPAEHRGRPVHLLCEGLQELAAWVDARVSGKGSEEVGDREEGDETLGRGTGGRDGEQGRAVAREAAEPEGGRSIRKQRGDQPAVAVVEQAGLAEAASRSRGAEPRQGGER